MSQKWAVHSKLSPGIPTPALANIDDANARVELGTVFRTLDDGGNGTKAYVYVKANATLALGDCVNFIDPIACTTVDKAATGTLNFPAGVAIGVITGGNYGIVQCWGYNANITTSALTSNKGDVLILKNGGICDTVAAGTAPTYIPLGVTAANVAGAALVTAYLRCHL
jgi:hypothetical protein